MDLKCTITTVYVKRSFWKYLHIGSALCRSVQTERRNQVIVAEILWTSHVSTLGSSSPTASGSSGGNWETTWRSWTAKVRAAVAPYLQTRGKRSLNVVFVCQAVEVQNQLQANKDVIPRETHEDEMEEMRREVQQCKEFIQAQQQLLQVSVTVRKGPGPTSFCALQIYFLFFVKKLVG